MGAWRLALSELAARGEATALEGCCPALSYATLAERAAAVGEALREGSVRPGDPVGLLSQGRGHDELVALAGVLGLGAVAVPLDAGSPAARLEAIVASSGCRALVCDEGARFRPDIRTVVLDADGERLEVVGDAATVDRAPTPELGAILHTSGSTGAPKPVPIRWEGLDAFTAWMIELTELTAGDRVLRVAELLFDLAWFDHLGTLRAGATLVTMTRRELASGKAIVAGLERLRPDVIYGVPGLFVSALGATEGWPCAARVICFAGEVFPPDELAELGRRSDAKLFNLFGPTETNVCTFHAVDRASLDGSPIPIGVATPYCTCWLVDERGERVEGPGVGELVVAGPTALGGTFATRDRVERDADGVFWFRGRIDRMVKIRGYRVEPGEVEAALMRHAAVREAAVIARAHPRYGKVLVGHVTLHAEVAPKVLRRHVAGLLASYMVPEAIEVHDALPRTPTGKIDLQALTQA